MSLLSPLLPAPPIFFPSLKLGNCAATSLPCRICPPQRHAYQRHTTQPESPSRTTTCSITRRRTLPHRHVQLPISTYGNNGCGTWTVVEEKTWSTSVAIMSKLQKLTQQNQAKSHTAPHDATANHPDWILQSLSCQPHIRCLTFWACHMSECVTPSPCIYCHLLGGSAYPQFTVYPSTN